NNRNNSRLAGLHQRQYFEGFVHRAEPARKKRKGVRLLNEVEFAIEEVIEIDQLRVAFDYFVGLLFEWQTNVESKTAVPTRSPLGRTHDPLPAAGNDHVIVRHHRAREILGHF